jgi:hypothetical protein
VSVAGASPRGQRLPGERQECIPCGSGEDDETGGGEGGYYKRVQITTEAAIGNGKRRGKGVSRVAGLSPKASVGVREKSPAGEREVKEGERRTYPRYPSPSTDRARNANMASAPAPRIQIAPASCLPATVGLKPCRRYRAWCGAVRRSG